MISRTPPVGNACVVEPGPDCIALSDLYPRRQTVLTDSGTSALALAIGACIERADKRQPEVIIPAYGCPDLVAAIEYAGGIARAVDLEPERPWISSSGLMAAINESTVAVVAAHFCGIPERLGLLRSLLPNHVCLIEDSAQRLPRHTNRPGHAADVTVLSFGRGKPMTLLGGGALLTRDMWIAEFARNRLAERPQPLVPSWRLQFQAAVYNRLRDPTIYGVLSRTPGLGIGQTRFQPLREVDEMDPARRDALPYALANYLSSTRDWRKEVQTMVEQAGLFDLPRQAGMDADAPLLRYTALAADAEEAERIVAHCHAHGVGATRMYRKPLSHYVSRPEINATPIQNAEDFAARLVTLPVHADLTHDYLLGMSKALREIRDLRAA